MENKMETTILGYILGLYLWLRFLWGSLEKPDAWHGYGQDA